MRILHIITRLIFGGAQENTVATCAAQVAAGHEVHLAYGPIDGPEGSLLDQAKASGAMLHEVDSMFRSVKPVSDVKCYRALKALVRRVEPDVVHTHSSKAGILGRGAAWACRGGGAFPKVIHTVHGLAFYPGQNPLVHRGYIMAERWAARRCDHMIAITPAMVDAMVEQGISPRERFTVVASGLEIEAFTLSSVERASRRSAVREALGLDDATVVVGLLGRLDRLKGQRDLLAGYAMLKQRLAPRQVKLLLVGDGFDRDILEQQVTEAGLSDAVIFVGRVEITDVPDYLAAMDVNTLPSYQEGQSRTLVQSVLAGTPVVAYATGGIPQVIEDGVIGRLVATGDQAALVEAIVATIQEKHSTAAMVERGRVAMRRFDQRLMFEGIEQVYRKVISGHDLRSCPA